MLKPVHSGAGLVVAASFGFPLLAMTGWLGRKKGGERIARLLAIVLLLTSLSQVIGCGSNGFTGSAPAINPSALVAGTYLIQVSATDATPGPTLGKTYYSIINLQMTTQ